LKCSVTCQSRASVVPGVPPATSILQPDTAAAPATSLLVLSFATASTANSKSSRECGCLHPASAPARCLVAHRIEEAHNVHGLVAFSSSVRHTFCHLAASFADHNGDDRMDSCLIDKVHVRYGVAQYFVFASSLSLTRFEPVIVLRALSVAATIVAPTLLEKRYGVIAGRNNSTIAASLVIRPTRERQAPFPNLQLMISISTHDLAVFLRAAPRLPQKPIRVRIINHHVATHTCRPDHR